MIVGTFAYFALAIALCAFGYVALFSVGAPFFLTGATMIGVSPWRSRGTVLWPALAAPWAFTAAYILIAPLGCTTTGSPASARAVTQCTNVLGIDYRGGASYDPPLMPALLAGLVAAVVVVVTLRWFLAGRTVDA